MTTRKPYLEKMKDEAAERRGQVERRINAGIGWLFVALFLVILAATFSSCTTTTPIAATGEVDGGKRGTATVVKVCGFVLAGDGSVKAAAANGTVRFVQTVDVRKTSVLGLVTWSTTIVTGE